MNKCRKYRTDLALLAGNDLEGPARLEAERHVATCPDCRLHWQELLAGQQVLDQARSAVPRVEVAESSVWASVSQQIRVVDERSRSGSWRGWLPVAALAAACLALLVITSDLLYETSTGNEFARQPVVSPGLPVLGPTSRPTTILPAQSQPFVPEALDATGLEQAPRRRSNRAERMGTGPYRGL